MDSDARMRWLAGCGVLVFGVLASGLMHLQVLRGTHFRQQAQRNAIRVVPIAAPRGMILDRLGRPLASNRLSLDVALIPQDAPDIEFTLTRLAVLTQQPLRRLMRLFQRNRSLPFVPAVLMPDAAFEQVIAIEEHHHELPGVVILPRAKRLYPYGHVAGHVLGFIGPVDREELRRLRRYGVRMTDWIGKAGVEAKYDAYLRGTDGGMVVEVDHRGRQMRVISRRDPVPGRTMVLTIDAELQRLVESGYEGYQGASVVLDPETGDVLALASAPAFYPEAFVSTDRRDAVQALHDRQQPLLNRAVGGTYPPGSIFKIVTAAAMLEEQRGTVDTTYHCSGAVHLGARPFHCWKRDGHGPENLRRGLAHSCNVYFIQSGLHVGPDPLTYWAGRFGLGRRAGIDVPGELRGLVPSRAWKRQQVREKWYDGDTANFSIGQGSLLVTPLQAARMVAVIANGGWLVQPHVVQRIGSVMARRRSAEPVNLLPETRAAIVNGLVDVIESSGGTGHRAAVAGMGIAGKTGTAQTGRPEQNHAWMVGFTPVDVPRAAFAVLYEFGGSGGHLPADLVQQIASYIQEWYVAPDPLGEDAT